MAYSPLVDRIAPPTTKKWSTRAGASITGAVVHHWAGTSMGGYHRLVESRDKASVNYLILNDGTLIGSVDEKYRAWTSGSWAVDRKRITIEVQNETGAPEWRVSAAALATLVRLLVDLATRHGWKRIAFGDQVRGHREFASTSCPGPYLWPRLPEVAADAQRARLGSPPKGTSKPAPAPKPSTGGGKVGGEWPGSPLLVDGNFGPVTRRAYQRLLAWDVTGKYTGHIDGQIGPMTTRAEQTWLRKVTTDVGPVDGVRGPRTIRALQRFLRSKGLYKGRIDGDQGPMTTKALQSYLNDQRKYA